MALSNPNRKVVQATAGEALVHGDVVHLIMQQSDTSDGSYTATKYDSADADIIFGTYGVVDSGISIASGDTVSCVVEGHCQAKVYYESIDLTTGQFLLIADGGTVPAADGCFCTDLSDTDAATLPGNLDSSAKRLAFDSFCRAQNLESTTVSAAAASRLTWVRIFNNPATPS